MLSGIGHILVSFETDPHVTGKHKRSIDQYVCQTLLDVDPLLIRERRLVFLPQIIQSPIGIGNDMEMVD